MARPLVSVVIVNWNGARYVADCLTSIIRQSYRKTEVIVVDNGSSDGSQHLIMSVYRGRLRLIQNESNIGFAAGNNVGIRAANGAYVALLNNDAMAHPGWLDALVRVAEADPRIGMCASKVYLRGRDNVLDSAGLVLSPDGIARGRGRLEPDREEFSLEAEGFLPSGCAAFYRRAMLDDVGLFDEDFFAYCEDSDLGLRGMVAGWHSRYVPTARVTHAYSSSTNPYSAFKAFHVERNRIWVVIKCFPRRLLVASLLYTMARYAAQAYGALRGRGAAARFVEHASIWAALGTLIRAYVVALVGLPTMWRKRQQVQALRRVRDKEFRAWLRTHRLPVTELVFKD